MPDPIEKRHAIDVVHVATSGPFAIGDDRGGPGDHQAVPHWPPLRRRPDVIAPPTVNAATGAVSSQHEPAGFRTGPDPALLGVVDNAMARILEANPGATVHQREVFRRAVVDAVTAAAAWSYAERCEEER